MSEFKNASLNQLALTSFPKKLHLTHLAKVLSLHKMLYGQMGIIAFVTLVIAQFYAIKE